ncbi:male sterility protein-domain-containing protein [Paraphoma chrysanthemicola]|uniref:Male sterility protein-domain-containing protein n=1 Tax=Paraphoma chrysanthemicola TaxID=798071 RepID=A0A8K0QYY3_9PLEO|nr:male sterility protein-domain-containing protein [Paraphoma chrysanthemicola]
MHTNYFVCTLGQASALSTKAKHSGTVNHFLDTQAQHHTLLPAVGFPIPQNDQELWKYKVLTFDDVYRGTNVFAQRLSSTLGALGQTVALLCHSSPEFLFTWLGLMRLGRSVLLIAPQCQPAAILHLCKSCDVTVLLYDRAHAERAQQTEALAKEREESDFKSQVLPLWSDEDVFEVIREPVEPVESPQLEETAIAYLHHTSGTSSGLPKPIPQSHRAAIGVLPHLPKIPGIASFTTTPLYHGGIADLFRAWTSNSMIWLFPGKDVPITARNICYCLDSAKSYASEEMVPKVKYFSSVPYVLQMMEADEQGLCWLQNMDIVGVGGAALPAEVGDRLVKRRVNLISRFGSAECGFLLSSFREFTADPDWQYLRNYNPPDLMQFEPREDNLAELVVKPGWPHMVTISNSTKAKKNREDGSFATADLFAPHPRIENAWLYHSRADSQLTLITGKKFDPAPLEAAIATSPHLDDVIIFGNGRPFPGALLLRSEKSARLSDAELRLAIEPIVAKMNRESQDHARISRQMLIPIPHQAQPLEKSSKGTIIRRAADTRFEQEINGAYESQDEGEAEDVSDEEVPKYLTSMIQNMTSQSVPLTDDMDLFAYGVDSIACMQLRSRLKRLIPNYTQDLPMSIIEDCGTIRRLADFVLRKRHGKSDASEEDEERLMVDLVEQYGSFEQTSNNNQSNGHHLKEKTGEVIVLTGATGALGAHILDLLQKSTSVDVIYCLVRGADEHAAKERVSKALQQKGLADLVASNIHNTKVKVVPAQLSDERLGLADDLYEYLANEVTSIIHVAWTVNFRLKLRSFVKDNIAGVRNLLNLALALPRTTRPRFTYCSSTASVVNSTSDPSGRLPELIQSNPAAASPLGYSRSKWVAEHICQQAHARTSLHGRIAVVRVGQLTGDSVSGVWNTKEAWPMMLSTARLIGCLPDLGDEPLDWLPVDVAATAFLEITQRDGMTGDMPVYHVLNPHQSPTWRQMLRWLSKNEDFEIVQPAEWVRRLEELEGSNHSAVKLLGLWKESYGKAADPGDDSKRPQFSMERTQARIATLKDVKPLDEAYVHRMWNWVQANVG